MVQALDKVAASITDTAGNIGDCQKTMIRSMVNMEEGLTKMINKVCSLMQSHEALQATMLKADLVVQTLVNNMEKLSSGQEKIIQDHLARAALFG